MEEEGIEFMDGGQGDVMSVVELAVGTQGEKKHGKEIRMFECY